MFDGRVPVRDRTVKIFRVDVRERAEIEIPLVRVVDLEIEIRVLVLIRLLEHRVFKVVALAQRAEAMVVVVHPLVDGRGLLADGLERGVRMEQRERSCQAIVGDSVHPNLAVIVGNVFHQPLDGVVGVGGLVGGFGIFHVDPGRKVEHALRLETAAQVLDYEDVTVLGEFLHERRHLLGRLFGNAVRGAAEQNGQRSRLIVISKHGIRRNGREDHRLQMNSVAHGDHDFLQCEQRLRRGLRLRSLLRGGGNRNQ